MNPPKGIDPKVWEMSGDVLATPGVYVGQLSHHILHERIALAIMGATDAEREECAKIVAWRVQLFPEDGTGLTARNALKEAANSIRNRSNTTTERNEG